MQISLDDLIAFVKVAELGSFKNAADELCVTPAALSSRMKKLEDRIGARLLDRTTRSVRTTVVGFDFLPTAQRIISGFEKSVDDLIDVIQIRAGVVSIATNVSAGMALIPKIVERYNAQFPDINIRITEGSSPRAVERVLSGECEIGICQNVQGLPDIEFEPLLEDRYSLVCHRDHPLSGRAKVKWEELKEHALISMETTTGTWKILETAWGDEASLLKGKFSVDHFNLLFALISRNLGISVLPTLFLSGFRDSNLISVDLHPPVIRRTLGIATVRDRSLSPAANALQEVTRRVFAEISA